MCSKSGRRTHNNKAAAITAAMVELQYHVIQSCTSGTDMVFRSDIRSDILKLCVLFCVYISHWLIFVLEFIYIYIYTLFYQPHFVLCVLNFEEEIKLATFVRKEWTIEKKSCDF